MALTFGFAALPLAWLQTRHGAWSPLAWSAAMVFALVLIFSMAFIVSLLAIPSTSSSAISPLRKV